ncbi:hypothetical protein TREVI0001_2007 [Treponema vincentii ATCC 35580]|uniref:Uncharacterized protein n=1 Tax=Treponema vincentii ATCC 35580 TaxID=596324 RepID=C8PQA5_9SPIR|nr:hypothetical protein TREVI0001_2007 [Treponema vincentii ATCC 35580]
MLLLGTSGIRAASDTLRISVAAWMPLVLHRSDVSAPSETRSQKCTRMYTFGVATTQ